MTTQNIVKDYYGKTLQSSSDLKTSACCTFQQYPPHILEAMKAIHPEVSDKYYGCGLTIPYKVENLKVLDLGSGSGRDCYILSKLVGEKGEVVGVDMTKEQLEVANRHLDYHQEKFGYQKNNVTYIEGELEKLDQLNLEKGSFDLIVSNCVINLCTDKEAVFKSCYELLKPGGELYFSDVYSDRRIPQELVNDPLLYGECLSGALYWYDFIDTVKSVGLKDPRVISSDKIEMKTDELGQKCGDIKFFSITTRSFKIPEFDNRCEEYGHSVIYKGGVSECPESFILDGEHTFEKNVETSVCRNTYLMLNKSRFQENFQFIEGNNVHLGLYKDCGSEGPLASKAQSSCC
jgi:arsenite methyltransferase